MTKEEMTKLLMESYDKGVEDAKQAAIIALEETVAVMVAQERMYELATQQRDYLMDAQRSMIAAMRGKMQ